MIDRSAAFHEKNSVNIADSGCGICFAYGFKLIADRPWNELIRYKPGNRQTGIFKSGGCAVPRLFELQKTMKSQNRVLETRFDSNSGEESLVIDERSRHSSTRVVEEKLHRLNRLQLGSFATEEYLH